MQFYMINKDPGISARALPDYAIFQVNVREGYQILSDIGHKFGASWKGQNKCYNPNHPNTMRYWKDVDSFLLFALHYYSCLQEYTRRAKEQGKKYITKWHVGYAAFGAGDAVDIIRESLPGRIDDYQFQILYLLNEKKDKMSATDYLKLKQYMSGGLK